MGACLLAEPHDPSGLAVEVPQRAAGDRRNSGSGSANGQGLALFPQTLFAAQRALVMSGDAAGGGVQLK